MFSLANKAIREKSDIINILLATLPEIMLEGKSKDNNLGYCEILIGKSSRIIFTLQNKDSGQIYKKFSFSFPFQIERQTDSTLLTSWIIKDKNGLEISSRLISILQSLSKDQWFAEDIDTSDEALVFYDHLLEAIKNVDLDLSIDDTMVWHLIRRLFLFEPGYLRYDLDDDEERLDPIYHPLHHLDIFFSNKATFKIGLIKEEIEKSEWYSSGFENLLDLESPCYFLKV
ncbi:hypothetical protein [Heyndrickxia vini]|uniref:Uncharacterized protein n=1 Tax=Heyndrickxia vini TaxID=1476025 RepID=A0ABX7E2S7_9BACI|nr:hypothetical protein [Heyndrickxia vini]QQZ09630.1 hypothetical protein I5776_01175 [Heyndrickxia vini]